ncbi:hypothetical protein BsWGS_23296 [Bradybaena similaris]
MASKGPKRESLSRYFKDLDECEDSSDGSDVETSQDDSASNEKKRGVAIIEANSVKSSSTVSKLAEKPELENKDGNKFSKQLTPGKRAEAKGDTTTSDTEKKTKLPSASECLSARSNPSFLKVSETKEINWDTREKRLDGGDDGAVTNFSSNAVPPPASYEPVTDPGIKVVDSEGRKRKTVWNDLEDQMTSTKAYKVHKDDGDGDGDGEEAAESS